MKDHLQREKDLGVLHALLVAKGETVLEWKTHVPFDGCFWQWSYAFCQDGYLHPIVITEQDKKLFKNRVAEILHSLYLPRGTRFDTFTAYPIDDNLWKDVPDGFLPNFWMYFHQYRSKPFTWKCDGCGLTTNEPGEMSGYTGNGGIGIEVTGWYCDDCVGRIRCQSCDCLNDPDSPWWDYSDELVKLYGNGFCPQCEEER